MLVAACECFGVSVAGGRCFLVPVRVGVGVGDDVDFALGCGADGVALSEALGVLVLVADADGLAYEVLLEDVGVVADSVGEFVGVSVGVCDGVAAGLDVGVWVGAGVVSDGDASDGDGSDGVVPELVGPDGDGLADSLALALADVVGGGLVVVSVGVLAVEVGVAVGVVGAAVGGVDVALGVGEVGVGEGGGLGGEAGSCSGSHDLPLDVVAVLAAAVFSATARLTPEVAVSRTLPAIRVTVAGRACAKRMKRPYPVLFVAAMERLVHYGLAS